VNVGGVFYGCKHAVVRFKEQGDGGAIVNTGSVAGLVGWGGTVYGATKGAVHQLTKAVAVEAAPFGIRVNALCPAAMPYTGFMAAGGVELPDDALEQVAESVGATHPLGRAITAEDCAEVAAFLASDRAANITGVLVPVDGGYVAK
jgi:NAD(P)-dependent dehydrogenase (short-subunit alcohol dehydrogenase family)